jgi:hypothetical protein
MIRHTYRSFALAAAAALLAFAAVACGDDDDNGDESPVPPTTSGAQETPQAGGAEGTVSATLKEFEIVLDTDTVSAGSVSFEAENIGPEDEHELVIIQSDLAPGDLPTKDDGSVDEDQVDVVNEIEEFAVGSTEELTVDLEAGSYVLICNIVEETDGATESHYTNGMHTALTVE